MSFSYSNQRLFSRVAAWLLVTRAEMLRKKIDKKIVVFRIWYAIYIVPIAITAASCLFFSSRLDQGGIFDPASWPLLEWREEKSVGSISGRHSVVVSDMSMQVISDANRFGAIVLACTWVLLLINTALFLYEIFKFNKDAKDHKDGALRWLAYIAAITLGVGVVLWGGILICVTTDLKLHKIVGLCFFAAFFVLDIIMYFLSRNGFSRESRTCSPGPQYQLHKCDLKRSHQYYGAQAFFVDMPIVLATLIAWLASTWGHHHHVDPIFVAGFYSGGWLVHLAMSQVIFLVISIKINALRIRDLRIAKNMVDGGAVTIENTDPGLLSMNEFSGVNKNDLPAEISFSGDQAGRYI